MIIEKSLDLHNLRKRFVRLELKCCDVTYIRTFIWVFNRFEKILEKWDEYMVQFDKMKYKKNEDRRLIEWPNCLLRAVKTRSQE